jgi:hypothetical protein
LKVYASRTKRISFTPEQNISVTPQEADIHYLLKEYEGKKYILAANPEKKEIKVIFSLPELNKDFKLKVLFEERKAPQVSGNSFADVFEGYGVHIYEIIL